ncbi:MAG: hypothetical protein ACI8R4_001863 [Paracoccaceae bacterium]|jgi:hypothetical protein
MSRIQVVTFLALVVLAGCGAEGEPIQPTMNAVIGISNDGSVHTNGGIGLHQGPVSLFLGF